MSLENETIAGFDQQHLLLLYTQGQVKTEVAAQTDALLRSKQHITNWHRRARAVQLSCYNAARWFDFWHFVIGAPLILLTAAGATSYYKNLVVQHHPFIGISTEIIGLLLPVLAALQTFLGYGQRAEKFRTTAAKYGSIRREMEQGSSLSFQTEHDAKQLMDRLRTELDTLAREAPEAPGVVWWWTQRGMKQHEASPLFPATEVAQNVPESNSASLNDNNQDQQTKGN